MVAKQTQGDGLLLIANDIQKQGLSFGLPRYLGNYGLGEWRLLDFSQSTSSSLVGVEGCFYEPFKHIRNEVTKGWYWVQFMSESDRDQRCKKSIWLWNASLPPDQVLSIRPYVYNIDSTSWLRPPPSLTSNVETPLAITTKAACRLERVNPSIITSFSTVGVTAARNASLAEFALEPYRRNPGVAAEVYLAMEPEIHQWKSRWSKRKPSIWDRFSALLRRIIGSRPQLQVAAENATNFLALLTPVQIEEVASEIAAGFSNVGSEIIAIASFIPEISRDCKSLEYELAVKAVANLLIFANEFQKRKHSSAVVEIVGGSRFRGFEMCDGTWQSHDRCHATQIDPQRGRYQLLKAIGSSIGLAKGSKAKIAIELEPGPCFLVNSWEAILEMTHNLSELEMAFPRGGFNRIGFNLDIAHWRLAGISPNDVKNMPEVIRRIFHGHISGHHRACHFGDIPLFDLNSDIDYAPWFDIFRLAASKANFSNYLSLELEAAKDETVVDNGLSGLRTVCGQSQGTLTFTDS